MSEVRTMPTEKITTASTVMPPVSATTTTTSTSTKTVVTQLKKRKQRKRTIWGILGGLVLLIVALVFANKGKEKPITVQTEKVTRRTITEIVQATGKIQPEVKVKVSPEVSGEIMQLPVKEGDHVTNGQLVAKIKPTTFEAQLEQASASVDAAKARTEQTKATLLNAKLELTRAEGLRKQNLISQADLEDAQSRYKIAEANSNAALFEVRASESQLKQVAESVRKTSVFAPMTGVVTSLISQLGEKVVGTSQFSGTEMMTISDLAVMNAEVEVDENDVVNIKLGNLAKVSIDAYPDRIFTGQVVEIANSAKLKGTGTQEQSTNFAVKIRLKDMQGADLRPGMSCTARIETETKENVVAVPLASVTRRESAMKKDEAQPKKDENKGEFHDQKDEVPTIVFVVDKGHAKQVPVKIGISDNSYVEITSGLTGNEEIIKGNYTAVSKELEDKKLIKVDNAATKETKSSN